MPDLTRPPPRQVAALRSRAGTIASEPAGQAAQPTAGQSPNPFRKKLLTSATAAQTRRQNDGLARAGSVRSRADFGTKRVKGLTRPDRRDADMEKRQQERYTPMLRPAHFAPPAARQGATTAHVQEDLVPSSYLMGGTTLEAPTGLDAAKSDVKKAARKPIFRVIYEAVDKLLDRVAGLGRGTQTEKPKVETKGKENEKLKVVDDMDLSYERGNWFWFCKIVTFPATEYLLFRAGFHTRAVQQAWREKVTLCLIAVLISLCVAFVSFAIQGVLCPRAVTQDNSNFYSWTNATSGVKMKSFRNGVTIRGSIYDYSSLRYNLRVHAGASLSTDFVSSDISNLFRDFRRPGGGRPLEPDYCAEAIAGYYSVPGASNGTGTGVVPTVSNVNCTVANPFTPNSAIGGPSSCVDWRVLRTLSSDSKLFFSWADVKDVSRGKISGGGPYEVKYGQLVVYGGAVLDISPFLANPFLPDSNLTSLLKSYIGRDITLPFATYRHPFADSAIKCIRQRYTVGYVEERPVGCLVSDAVTWVTMGLFFGLVAAKFLIAIAYLWMEAPDRTSGVESIGRGRESPNIGGTGPSQYESLKAPSALASSSTNTGEHSPVSPSAMALEKGLEECNDPFVIGLVTCYSENEKVMRATLDSVARSDYHDYRKLLFVVCDGIVTGSGETRPTSEISLSLIRESENLPAEPKAYLAIAKGARQQNVAEVHAGYYSPEPGRNVPIIVVVKVGTEDEKSAKKPGNRGKRDSQMILINFLSKVLFDDAMTPLEHDLYRKVTILAGVTPDMFEHVMAVDADTKVQEDALRYLVQAMTNDTAIMGCCGETQVANKSASWVTMMQVWEYYISHTLGKSFESFFGCVTCLPGCFSMYRIKALLENGRWVPILTCPEIADEYSENEVHTLHAKNLLLLGEDRFLTTLLLRTFPKRKTVYIPQAVCETNVPDTFSVLLSQRRRWINSTVHNLFELMFVSELCGVFCFSMQFVIFWDLVGTFSSPAMLLFSFYFIILAMASASPSFLPLILMGVMLLLPASIILIADVRRIPHFLWMGVYFGFYWVFTFVLPLYSFWHFDDFTWGETRRIAGGGGGGHNEPAVVKSNALAPEERPTIPLKRFVDWEMELHGYITPEITNAAGSEFKSAVEASQNSPWDPALQVAMSTIQRDTSSLRGGAGGSSYLGGSVSMTAFSSVASRNSRAPISSSRTGMMQASTTLAQAMSGQYANATGSSEPTAPVGAPQTPPWDPALQAAMSTMHGDSTSLYEAAGGSSYLGGSAATSRKLSAFPSRAPISSSRMGILQGSGSLAQAGMSSQLSTSSLGRPMGSIRPVTATPAQSTPMMNIEGHGVVTAEADVLLAAYQASMKAQLKRA